MAAAATTEPIHQLNGHNDPFTETNQISQQPYFHRFSSKFEVDAADLGAASSPSQFKRVLEAHLLETERRLHDTQKLGTSLLQQQSELQDKLHEVEQQQDEAEISPELRQRLAYIGREHDDVSREIARSLLAPKSRAVSGEEQALEESVLLTSQATGSPTKISAPNRRSRNQPTNRAGDLQFAADISTSLLAQVRQLQAAVAERDDALKDVSADRSKLEQDLQAFAQKLRSHDENEQRYKDENWNLEAQNHQLLSAQREASDKEKRLNGMIAIANAEKARLLSEADEFKLTHSKAIDEHEAKKKAHETELHRLRRDFDAVDMDRTSMQSTIDELTAQNHELATAMASRFRNQSPQRQSDFDNEEGDLSKDLSTPEQSPPPSPTKATPRHGGLESETLRSSLHHAHRMIQNLKGNIHREKTEKIELKRMLQEARDELEQRRSDNILGNGSKKPKPKNEIFKKPVRPDMLGGTRRARTDVEMQEEEWEDQKHDGASSMDAISFQPRSTTTDQSDAYQTAHETESNFETADERMTTESEAFETGAESLAGDSTDDLTETESTAPQFRKKASVRHNRPAMAFKSAGSRDSYLSTASTSDGEEDDAQTPIQPQLHKFKLRNTRSSSSRQTDMNEGTPDTVRTQNTAFDSPAAGSEGRSPPGVGQSLFAELEGINDVGSNYSTPARSDLVDDYSTPVLSDTPSKSISTFAPQISTIDKPLMVDSGMMTEPMQPELVRNEVTAATVAGLVGHHLFTGPAATADSPRVVSIGEFPLPPTASSPDGQHIDSSTQYTPQKSLLAGTQLISQQPRDPAMQYAPSEPVYDASTYAGNTLAKASPNVGRDAGLNYEVESPDHVLPAVREARRLSLAYSGMFAQDVTPQSPTQPVQTLQEVIEPPTVLGFSSILSQQTQPIAPPPSLPPTSPLPAIPSASKREKESPEKAALGGAAGGMLAGAATALGLSWSKDKDVPRVAEDSTSGPAENRSGESTTPLQGISGNAVLREKRSPRDSTLKQGTATAVSSIDPNHRIVLTHEEIERILQARKNPATAPVTFSSIHEAVTTPKELYRSPDMSEPVIPSSSSAPTSPPLRPSSASSGRPLTANNQHPPLPSNYKNTIARANSQVQTTPYKRESITPAVGTVMGPPLMPASAMRRPKTPSTSVRSTARENATPRVIQSTRARGTESQLSRRSSVSSFVSEIDERFNIHAAGYTGAGYEPAPGTDPRMIQAITQTMIGEYLWKYTRKTGSKEMSSTRHRRYFWVHPYTKTLYWSEVDPSLPGSKQGTSRSVPIESIRVISDDNPMPPGLHRKSLEITTPSRKVRFTATTGQRHETWFNALSYLLLRGEPPDTYGAYSTGGNEITRDDIDEFRVRGDDPHLTQNGRISTSTYNSRTTTGTSKRVSGAVGTHNRQALPANVTTRTSSTSLRQQASVDHNTSAPANPSTSGRASRAVESSDADRDGTIRARSVSRVSKIMGSITGRTSKASVRERDDPQHTGHDRGPSRESGSIYDASVVSAKRDSAEETRQEMLRQEAAGLGSRGGLENVRACCDGKHDVSTLHHDSHRHDRQGALSSMSDRINRSMSSRA